MDHQVILIEGSVQHPDARPFTNEEREGFYERFLEFIEGEKMLFGGKIT